jgi:hypothetical protein
LFIKPLQRAGQKREKSAEALPIVKRQELLPWKEGEQ